ncbi:MAG: regulatory protein RecX [Geothermobacteraceae bacterium]
MALRLLTRRDYGSRELAARLSQRGCPREEIEKALERLQELDYIDDDRYARHLAGRLVNEGRAWGGRLRLELKQRGITGHLAEEAAADAENKAEATALVRDLARRRYSGFDYDSATDRERRRVVHFFQRRGFPLELILAALRRPD